MFVADKKSRTGMESGLVSRSVRPFSDFLNTHNKNDNRQLIITLAHFDKVKLAKNSSLDDLNVCEKYPFLLNTCCLSRICA